MPDFRSARIHLDSTEEVDAETLASPEDADADERPARQRDGLPPAFRMRHSPHYVEPLMGERPIQTVRQIAVAELEAPCVRDLDLADLADSVRQYGILQPLVVGRAPGGSSYRVIAGANRLAAARIAGLATVPCVVIDAGSEHVTALRREASQRARSASAAAAPDAGRGNDSPDHEAAHLRVAFEEINGLLECVKTLMPLAAEPDAHFRRSILRDLMLVEADRAATLAAAASLLTEGDSEPARQVLNCRDVLQRVREKATVAARLKGVHLDWPEPDAAVPASGDVQALMTAWSLLVYAYLTIAGAGDRVVVTLAAPKVRPAVLFEVVLQRQQPVAEGELRTGEAGEGTAVGAMLHAVERCARRHGGRFCHELSGPSARGLFVMPQPID